MPEMEICHAIEGRRLLRFHYDSEAAPGYRTVEPHMLAYSKAENLCLSAWLLGGESASDEGPGWRQFLVSDMSHVTALEETFSEARPGYQPDGGKSFHNVQCAF